MLTFLLIFLISIVHSRRLDDVIWTTTNPIFEISNNAHVLNAQIGDRLSIVCPQPTNIDHYEYSVIYAVSAEEYHQCYLGANPHRVGACDSPNSPQSLSIVFRQFSPTPGGLEFQPAHTYYFITTSTGTPHGIDRRRGGLCETNKMKLKVDILPEGHHVIHGNPKFAARTFEESSLTTPVMYIIHTADSSENDDDAASTQPLLCLILTCFLMNFF
ncbi:unnamed protein product, partial [Mesorhabditis belari]|uniref:Ephrin RBD domain-containing protein n=1 Tax=Mesorhabditis belari TaxID=2138241 RepID=A0AAF3FIK7_9BILA